MRTLTLFLMGLIASTCVVANAPNRNVWLETEINHQICWYKDQKYSLGAIIAVHDKTLICALKHKEQPNGPVAWLPLDKKGNVIYPKQAPKITVN